MKGLKKLIATTLAVAVSMAMAVPVTTQAAITAPSKAVGYLTSADGQSNVSFEVRGMKASEQIKMSSVKSSNKAVGEVTEINGTYYFEKDNINNSYCYLYVTGKKAGTTTISYKVGSKTKKTKLTVKKYVNPVKKITLTGVNDGEDFSSLTDEQADVSGEWDDQAGKQISPFTVEAAKNPVLYIEPASGWSITELYVNINDNMYENYYKYEGNKYSGAQTFDIYKMTDDARNLSVTFVNKDGGKIMVNYQLKPWD